MKIDLNCDMGEAFGPWPMGDDDAMLDIVSSANVACGFHAGDPSIMFRTAETAKRKGVAMVAIVHDDDVREKIADRMVDVTKFAAAA